MAETRDTQILEDVVESTEIENPRTTEEAILAKIIAGEEVNINARTRYQAYLKELSSISGGNPNSVETITGTVANPWGDVDPAELGSEILNNNATAIMTITTEDGTITAPMLIIFIDELDYSSFSVANINVGSDYGNAAQIMYAYKNLIKAKSAIFGGGTVTVTDLLEVASQIPTTLMIIHHPLPEDNT